MSHSRDSKTSAPRPRGRAHLGAVVRVLAAVAAMAAQLEAPLPCRALAETAAPVLYVYLHTELKFAELERILKGHLPGLRVTVFGRFRDFEEAMTARPPDAVLGLGALLGNLGIHPALQGTRAGQDWETFALLSVGDTFETTTAGRTVGVVDLFGREATQAFVGTLLGTTDVRVKRVTKREDLLPLLQLGLADGVVGPTTVVRALTERSRLPLRVRELGAVHVNLPALGVRNTDARERIVGLVRALDPSTNQMLGVDSWRTP